MYGIGIDMTSVSRIEKSMSKENFREFVFTKKELEMFFETEKPKYKSLAANFRAKEAFAKALGTGVRGFNLNEIEILRDGMGAPYMNFYGRAKRCFDRGNAGGCRWNLVLSYLFPVLLHGVYDTCCMSGTTQSTLVFVAFVVVMYLAVFNLIRHEAKTDAPV